MNIPGIGAGKYDNLIETLMKKERAPRDSAAEDLKKYERQNAIWRKINQFSSEIREKTRDLYSFNNPFVEKTVTSSNERAVTATASRDAREQTFKISIDRIAQADSFLSDRFQAQKTAHHRKIPVYSPLPSTAIQKAAKQHRAKFLFPKSGEHLFLFY